MCIIVLKPKNIPMPSMDILKTCFINNPDGAGFMYRRGNKIYIEKGFMKIEDLLSRLSVVKKKDECCIHFRIATHGVIMPGNTHPFPITSEKPMLHVLTSVVNRAMCHNGILSGYAAINDNISDSGFFAKMLYPCTTEKQYQSVLDVHSSRTNSKFIVMTGKFTVHAGYFKNDGGIYYSNDGYTPNIYAGVNTFIDGEIFYDSSKLITLSKYDNHRRQISEKYSRVYDDDKARFQKYLDSGV